MKTKVGKVMSVSVSIFVVCYTLVWIVTELVQAGIKPSIAMSAFILVLLLVGVIALITSIISGGIWLYQVITHLDRQIDDR